MKRLAWLSAVAEAVMVLAAVVSHPVQSKATETNDSLSSDISVFSGEDYLDTEEKYLVRWNINSDGKTISFEVTAETKGYVGFGISPNGGMKGADILIAGVKPDGTLYSSDRHGVESNKEPVEDAHADWEITFGEEKGNHTKLHFHRLLNTYDKDDFRITDDTMRIIWALGETDDIRYHGITSMRRGTKSANFFLQGGRDEFDGGKYHHLNITAITKLPAQKTTYWCTIHMLEAFPTKQHVVAIEPVLQSPASLKHTHHFIIFRCFTWGNEAALEHWVGKAGDFCYNPSFPFMGHCSGYIVYGWSKGGKPLVFPPNLGLPIASEPGQQEYYALQVHYDNPEALDNVEFETGARLFYTPNLRKTEVGIFLVGQEFNEVLTVPPQSNDFVVAGHCSGECTERKLGDDGITIFNNLFHAHLAGRKLKLRHFRGNQELPCIDVDNYYDFDFQQNKPLMQSRKVEGGDQLTVECTYDSMKAENGGAVIGGLSTHNEMCQAFVYYYPRREIYYCSSGQDLKKHFELLGMTNYKEKYSSYAGGMPAYDITEPTHLAGDYWNSVSFKVNWTKEFRDLYQNEKRYGEQLSYCDSIDDPLGNVSYPENMTPYMPPNDCKGVIGGSSLIFPSSFLYLLLPVAIFGGLC